MNRPTRRQVLALSTGFIGTLGGCSSSIISSSDTTLGGISLVNTTSESTTFDVIVEYDEEITYWSSHKVEPAPEHGSNIKTIVPGLPDDSGSVVVHGRVEEQRRALDLTDKEFAGKCILGHLIWQKHDSEFGTSISLVEDLDTPPEKITCQN